MRQFRLLAITSIALAVSSVLAAQAPHQTPNPAVTQAVEAAFPASLRFAPASPTGKSSPDRSYDSCAAVLNTAVDGTPAMIAAGYSGDGSEIALLRYSSGVASIVTAITDRQLWLTGGSCEIQSVDLADPAQPKSPLAHTVKISFGGPDWYFLWDGKKLQNITALDTTNFQTYGDEWGQYNVPNSAIYLSDIVDIEHHGPEQIVGKNGDWENFPQDDGIAATPTYTLFRYNATSFAFARTFLGFQQFGPNVPKTPEELLAFNNASLLQIYRHSPAHSTNRLEIINGDRDGSNRVTSAKVEVNGVEVVLAGEINQGIEKLTRTIQLEKENDIRVTVDGPKTSHVYVTVE